MNKKISGTCSRCGKKFVDWKTLSCTSIEHFVKICPKCELKAMKDTADALDAGFNDYDLDLDLDINNDDKNNKDNSSNNSNDNDKN